MFYYFIKKSTFNYNLYQALLFVNIPDESTLRKTYVSEYYKYSINKIRNYCENQKLWVSIDETTDLVRQYVANVIGWYIGSWKPR